MNVLVNGIGNIGQTLINILNDYKKLLKIDRIYALKNTQLFDWNREEVTLLEEKGIIICTKKESQYVNFDTVKDSLHYIFDCNANTFGLKNKEWYKTLPNLLGCSAQGSEKSFGISYMTGVNNEVIRNQKYVHIVSCNTHAIASILKTLSNNDFSNIVEGDFVVVRRSEDLGNHQRLVTANVVSRHMDQQIGTHHAIDVKDLFEEIDVPLDIQSSDITTPSQLMHVVRFNLKFNKAPQIHDINASIASRNTVSVTTKFDSNIVFEMGRRYSRYGRLFSHSILNNNNLLFDYTKGQIKGWAFIPQEGNTILSTLHAFLLQTNTIDEAHIMNILTKDLVRASW